MNVKSDLNNMYVKKIICRILVYVLVSKMKIVKLMNV